MSLAEIKDSIEALSVEDRLEIAAWIAFLNRATDPSYQAEMDARMTRMDAGKKFTQADLARVHAELNAKGQ
jgi:hypothetical protein